ncbi:GIY-YIG nuclease family protein [Bacillus sp. Wb]
MGYVIYSITCLTNNVKYIGRSQEVEKRWRAHKNMLRRSLHNNTLLQNDWNLYGEDAFLFEILHEFNDLDESIIKEQEYIDDDSVIKYNISDAKAGGDTFTNNPRKEEIRKLKSINSSGENNPMYGKPKSDLMIKRVKEANSKPVTIDGIKYSSAIEASRTLNVKPTTVNYRIQSKSSRFENWNYA